MSNRSRGESNKVTDDMVFGPKMAKRSSILPQRFKPARRNFSHRFTSKKQLKSALKKLQNARQSVKGPCESVASKSLSASNSLIQDFADVDTPHDQDNSSKIRVDALSDIHSEEDIRYGIRQDACNNIS